MGKALIRSLMYIVNKNYEVTFDLSMFTQCILKPSLRNVFLYSSMQRTSLVMGVCSLQGNQNYGSYHDANFLVTDGTASCHTENI